MARHHRVGEDGGKRLSNHVRLSNATLAGKRKRTFVDAGRRTASATASFMNNVTRATGRNASTTDSRTNVPAPATLPPPQPARSADKPVQTCFAKKHATPSLKSKSIGTPSNESRTFLRDKHGLQYKLAPFVEQVDYLSERRQGAGRRVESRSRVVLVRDGPESTEVRAKMFFNVKEAQTWLRAHKAENLFGCVQPSSRAYHSILARDVERRRDRELAKKKNARGN